MDVKYKMVRTREQVDELLQRCGDAEFEGSTKFPGMSYEQGVLYGLSWMIHDEDVDPIKEE